MLWRDRSNNNSDNDGNGNYGNDDNDKLLNGPRQGITCQNLGTLQVVSLYYNLDGIELKVKNIIYDKKTDIFSHSRIIINNNILYICNNTIENLYYN